MQVWADVYDTNWVRQGEGPVGLISASVTRMFDGAGSISLDAPGTDERALALLVNEARVKIWVEDDGDVRQMGAGVIRSRHRSADSSGWKLRVSGPDMLDDLKRKSTWLNRQYGAGGTQVTVAYVVEALAALADWDAECDETGLISASFDGVSVLKAIQTLADENGLHMRQKLSADDTSPVVEVGVFGDDTGLWLVNAEVMNAEAYGSENIALLESVTLLEESEAIANRVVLIGGGEGQAALTLKNSTRSGVLSMTGPDGQTLYYIEDAASIALYGVIEKVAAFKGITPLKNTDAYKVIAANALYDAGAAWLERNSMAQQTYQARVRGCRQTIQPGDKVHLAFTGTIRDDEGHELPEGSLVGEFWVLKVTETAGADGTAMGLEIATIDKQRQDAASVVVGAIESINLRNLKAQTYPVAFVYTTFDFIQANTGSGYSDKWANFTFKIDDKFTDITEVSLRFWTQPLFTTVFPANLVGYVPFNMPNHFWVLIDDDYPSGLSLYINSADVTAALGGPWNVAPTNAAADVTVDITTYIRATMYQNHAIQIRCVHRAGDTALPAHTAYPGAYASHGVVWCTVTVLGTCQAILGA